VSIINDQELEKLSFEQAMAKLQEIVSKLEKGEESLESAISMYQYGNKLKLHCERMLSDAKVKVEKITKVTDGKVETTSLD
jgi:exodeoxyribonuclease VII small subunit